MEDYQNSTNFNYLAEDTLFQQFSQLAENVCRTLPQGTDGVNAITAQIEKLKSQKEQWPSKSMMTWRERENSSFYTRSNTQIYPGKFCLD